MGVLIGFCPRRFDQLSAEFADNRGHRSVEVITQGRVELPQELVGLQLVLDEAREPVVRVHVEAALPGPRAEAREPEPVPGQGEHPLGVEAALFGPEPTAFLGIELVDHPFLDLEQQVGNCARINFVENILNFVAYRLDIGEPE